MLCPHTIRDATSTRLERKTRGYAISTLQVPSLAVTVRHTKHGLLVSMNERNSVAMQKKLSHSVITALRSRKVR